MVSQSHDLESPSNNEPAPPVAIWAQGRRSYPFSGRPFGASPGGATSTAGSFSVFSECGGAASIGIDSGAGALVETALLGEDGSGDSALSVCFTGSGRGGSEFWCPWEVAGLE